MLGGGVFFFVCCCCCFFFFFTESTLKRKKHFFNIFQLYLDLHKYMCDLNTVFIFADTFRNYERFHFFVNIFIGLLCP